ncbi:MAG: DUF134 domain-containing protein [Bacteroidetes bacterium]|nr:DUF134 domain-containing protein [Bacteroidota bacterium]
MARPYKERYVATPPQWKVFQPSEHCNAGERITITADEVEALRLADLYGYEQSEAAVAMNVSRQTFGRILERAHQKVADALIHAKALEIETGPVIRTRRRRIYCQSCRHDWIVPQKEVSSFQCPRCSE